MATVEYITKQDETVDLACWKHYGYTAGITERVLDTNPDLAAKGPILPLGTKIQMPVVVNEIPEAIPVLKLWD